MNEPIVINIVPIVAYLILLWFAGPAVFRFFFVKDHDSADRKMAWQRKWAWEAGRNEALDDATGPVCVNVAKPYSVACCGTYCNVEANQLPAFDERDFGRELVLVFADTGDSVTGILSAYGWAPPSITIMRTDV